MLHHRIARPKALRSLNPQAVDVVREAHFEGRAELIRAGSALLQIEDVLGGREGEGGEEGILVKLSFDIFSNTLFSQSLPRASISLLYLP